MACAQKWANSNNGTWSPADQAAILALAAKTGMESAKRSGVCWEVCRRWVRARLAGTWTHDTIYEILSPSKGFEIDTESMEELIRTHAGRNTKGVAENYTIDGLTNHKTLYRTYSGFVASGLKSRAAVLKVIFNTPGAYIFAFLANVGGGHAIAFDTTSLPYAIMDPNSGDGTFPSKEDFISFFTSYYGELYKTEYTGGERELTRYSVT